jgi:hypothetical protein
VRRNAGRGHSQVCHQAHEAFVLVILMMAVEQRKSRIVGDEIDLDGAKWCLSSRIVVFNVTANSVFADIFARKIERHLVRLHNRRDFGSFLVEGVGAIPCTRIIAIRMLKTPESSPFPTVHQSLHEPPTQSVYLRDRRSATALQS